MGTEGIALVSYADSLSTHGDLQCWVFITNNKLAFDS